MSLLAVPDPAMRSEPSRLSRTSVAKLQRLEFEEDNLWIGWFFLMFLMRKTEQTEDTVRQ